MNLRGIRTMTETLILLKCKDCTHEEMAPAKCAVTGHVIGKGWHYICPVCKGTLEVKFPETSNA